MYKVIFVGGPNHGITTGMRDLRAVWEVPNFYPTWRVVEEVPPMPLVTRHQYRLRVTSEGPFKDHEGNYVYDYEGPVQI